MRTDLTPMADALAGLARGGAFGVRLAAGFGFATIITADNALTAMAPRIELFAFRYRDPRTGKWIRARYVGTRKDIAARYAAWEITGPAEIRDVDPDARAFSPHPSFKQMMDAEVRRYNERPPEPQPTIDATEAFLLAVFLRRYLTYCARRGRFAAMNGAARLYVEYAADLGA